MQRLAVTSKFFLALTATLLLFVSGVMVPPAGIILLPLVPQPVLAFGIRHGVALSAGLLFLATVLLLIFAGEELAFIYGIFALMAGLLLGLLGRHRSIEFLVAGVAAALFTAAGGLLLYLYGSWTAMMEDFRASLLQNLATAVRMQEKMGFSRDSLALLEERGPHMVEMMLQLLPSLLFISFGLTVLLNIVLLCRRFPERRFAWLSCHDLREWKGPEPMVWGLIACGFALFIPWLDALRLIAINILLVIAACYFAQGLAVVAYLFQKNNVPRFLRGITYTLIVFQQIFTLMVVGVGLFDLWGDFRRLGKNNLNASRAS
ncbi:MAG TPA: DUF2232 domain-containing protein [Candidatus Binatia bacterium]|nr:DUF2232 domain-containing protein [Candidatus Binatia bacterium]